MLPGRAPNLLLNGATGIAVAMACDIPPHNLAESAGRQNAAEQRQRHPRRRAAACPGSGLPHGRQHLAGEDREDLRRLYGTGRGGFTVRAQQHLEETTTGNRVQIVSPRSPTRPTKSDHRADSPPRSATRKSRAYATCGTSRPPRHAVGGRVDQGRPLSDDPRSSTSPRPCRSSTAATCRPLVDTGRRR